MPRGLREVVERMAERNAFLRGREKGEVKNYGKKTKKVEFNRELRGAIL